MEEPSNPQALNAVYLIHFNKSTSYPTLPPPIPPQPPEKPAIKYMELDHFLLTIIIWKNLESYQRV